MAKKSVSKAQRNVKAKSRQPAPEASEELVQILQQARVWCLRNLPMLWTPDRIREEPSIEGERRWVIAVHLVYPTGHEGYVGDIQYDGKRFTRLTDLEVMRERSRQIAADPERQRLWDGFLAPTLPPTERQHMRTRLPANGAGGQRDGRRRK
jgi:hypothetical protein